MKKFMKAIAFVTVMCLALSTVAFAAGTAELGNTEKVLNITVTGAGNDQVALVVTASDATDFSAPLYIDQKAAVDGAASFTAVLTNAEVDAVDVYVGYATYAAANAAPEKIGNDVAITNPITEVTIVKTADIILQEDIQGLEQTGAAIAATFNVTAPEGASATDMIWAIRFNNDADVKYSDPINVTGYGIGSALDGGITLGFSFLNGSELNNINPVTISSIDAIFMFVGENDFEQEVFTNNADAANKLIVE